MEEPADNSARQSRLAATADPQLPSPFFSALPPEVRRMIYVEVWRHNWRHNDAHDDTGESSLKQHIIKQESGGYTHSPCVVSDQTAPDRRPQRLATHPPPGELSDIWYDRIESDWAVHWPCEELYKKHASRRRPSTFMAPLLTCRLMYQESKHTLYTTLTFVFTDHTTASTFIPLFGPSALRSLELAIRIPLALKELYLPVTHPPPQRSLPSTFFPFSTQNNPWARTCAALAACTRLRRLSLWFDIRHLDGWTGRVWERIFFADLWAVRVRGDFVLALPQLDAAGMRRRRPEGAASAPGVDAYLAGEAVLDGAPFTVVRGPRPDYWAAHLGRVMARTRTRADVLAIEAGPG